jgi:hypothetical protein
MADHKRLRKVVATRPTADKSRKKMHTLPMRKMVKMMTVVFPGAI